MALGIIICHALKSILLLLRLTFSEFVEKGGVRERASERADEWSRSCMNAVFAISAPFVTGGSNKNIS